MKKDVGKPQNPRGVSIQFSNTHHQQKHHHHQHQHQHQQQQGDDDLKGTITSLSSTGIFRDNVTSCFDRMQERMERQRSESNARPVSSLYGQDETNTMAHRSRDPLVSLSILEQMRLVFDLYEWRRHRKHPKGLSFDRNNSNVDNSNSATADNTDSVDNDIAAMLRWKQQHEERQKLRRLLRAERGDGSFSSHTTSSSNDDSVIPGIPFSVFEEEIVEPFFDALFPPERLTRPTTSTVLESLHSDISPSMLIGKSGLRGVSAKSMTTSGFTSYQKRRASHVEAAENLFCVMDTNGDGFLSWDELSTYILQSGQRLLLSEEYGGDTGSAITRSEEGIRIGKSKKDTMTDYAGRTLRFTQTPANSTQWQQQYPLVRYLYHTEPISHLIFANRGRRYITAAWDGLVKLWRPDPRLADARGKSAIVHERTIFAAGAPIIDIVLAPESLGDAEVLVVASMDGTVTLLRLGTGEVLKTFIGRCLQPISSNNNIRCVSSTTGRKRLWRPEGEINSVAVESDISNSTDNAAFVMRPQFKVRAYHREAIEMFFTDVSRYFTGLDVVAPTYEHLERRRPVKADVLLEFGTEPGVLGDWNCGDSQRMKSSTPRDTGTGTGTILPSSSSFLAPFANIEDLIKKKKTTTTTTTNKKQKEEEKEEQEEYDDNNKKEKKEKVNDDNNGNKDDDDDDAAEKREEEKNDEGEIEMAENNNNNNNNNNNKTSPNSDAMDTKKGNDGEDAADDKNKNYNNNNNRNNNQTQRKREGKYTINNLSEAVRHPRSQNRAHEKSWFARSVAVAKYEKTNSSSLLPTGALLFLGFETGVLQIYCMRQRWFSISNLSLTRVEPPELHEPVLTLTLHRAAITRIIASESNDLLMTASDDCTVVIRHISRMQVPFVTLGDSILSPTASPTPSFHMGGHTKRITCMCWNATRSLIVTGGADRLVLFWMASSSRPLYRVDLRTFSSSSTISGFPIDVSFLQPPRHPLLLLVLDSRRILYFFDCVSFQCLHMMCDDSPQSLRTGELLRARYDIVEDRIILGGRYIRFWDSQQNDEYPDDYRGHRRPVVALAFQRTWRFFVSADDAVIIIWNVEVVDLLATQSDTSRTGLNTAESKTSNRVFKDTDEKNLTKKSEESVNNNNDSENESVVRQQRRWDRRSTAKMVDAGCRWALATAVTRSWRVEGGICSLALEQSDSSHLFVALLKERRIVEYNSFSGSPLRSFDFPTGMEEVVSVACSGIGASGSFINPVAFLCGSFEREQSPNGVTALYTLSIEGAAMLGAGGSASEHRRIVTSDVGVSCSTIVSTLGIVVIGHRGGISVTPIDEATTCPIACIRLTDRPAKKKVGKGKETRKVEGTTTTTTTSVTTSEFSKQSAGQEGGVGVGVGGGLANPITSTFTSSGNMSKRQRSLGIPETRNMHADHCRPSPPLDLVALFPGPLIQDPVAITRECMQQRERYLFYTDPPSANASTRVSSAGLSADEVGDVNNTRETTMMMNNNEGGGGGGVGGGSTGNISSKGNDLPPLLLFSEEFIASSSAFGGNFGVFLREQLATLGFVGQTVPIGKETDYLASGSDDGLLQVWNLRTMSEVMRFRVTYTFDAITALEVNREASYIAVGDENGYVLLLDVRNVDWMSAVPLEMCTGVENGVQLLRRWRGHRQGVTSVRFVRASQASGHREASSGFTLHRSSHVIVPPFTRTMSTTTVDNDGDGNRKSKHNSISIGNTTTTTNTNTTPSTIFLCTSSEDSYIYTWCWEPGSGSGGYVHCIGCFGGGVEKLAKPPVGKLTDNAWKVMDIVRKAYMTERLLCPGGVLSVPNAQSAIHSAANIIYEDIRAVKSGQPLKQRGTNATATAAASASTINEKSITPRRPSLARERSRTRNRSFRSSLVRRSIVSCNAPSSVGDSFGGGGVFHPSYVLAFEEGLYYERNLVDLLERLLTELQSSEKNNNNNNKTIHSLMSSRLGETRGMESETRVMESETRVMESEKRKSLLLPPITTTSILVDKSASATPFSATSPGLALPINTNNDNNNNNNNNTTTANVSLMPITGGVGFSEDVNEKEKSVEMSVTTPLSAAVFSSGGNDESPTMQTPASPHHIVVETIQSPHSLQTNFSFSTNVVGSPTKRRTQLKNSTQQQQQQQQEKEKEEKEQNQSQEAQQVLWPSPPPVPPTTSPTSSPPPPPVFVVNTQTTGLFDESPKSLAMAVAEEWNCLPPVTVRYATAMPLPRSRSRGTLMHGKRAHRSSILEGLPLLSHVIGLPVGENDGRKSHGVKVLLKEKKTRRPYYTFFLERAREQAAESKIPSSDLQEKISAQKTNHRRQRKTQSLLWGPSRVMGTLMSWNSPRVSSGLKRRSNTSTITTITTTTTLTATSGAANLPVISSTRINSGGGSVSFKGPEGESALFPLPLFIPLSLGTNCSQTISSSHEMSKGRSVVMLLQEEMEAMKTTLQATLREKQILLAQERATSQGMGGNVRRSVTGLK